MFLTIIKTNNVKIFRPVVHFTHPLRELGAAGDPGRVGDQVSPQVLGAVLAGVKPRHDGHQGPGVILGLDRGRGGEVGGYGVEQGPGLVTQLHPVRGTLVMISGDLDSSLRGHLDLVTLLVLSLLLLVIRGLGLCARGRGCLHPLLEVRAGPTWPPIHVL